MQTYDWYKNTYLETHLKLVEQSIQLAQTEFQTRVQMLQFYEKQLDNLRQGKGASGTGASREAVGKFNADAIRKRDEKLAKQASLQGYDFNSLIQPVADQVSARVDQEEALVKIATEQGLDRRGDTQLERVRLAQELRAAGAKAARKGGKSPDMKKLTSAAMTIARVSDPALMNKTEAELIEEQKKITEPQFATPTRTRVGGGRSTTGTVDLGFNINDVQVGPDGKTLGLYVVRNNNAQFEPLTLEQERIYNLENRVNRLRSQIDDTYGQDIDIEKIIERGRDIYSRQYAPQRMSRKEQEEQSRIALMSEIRAMDEQKGTNLAGIYSAYSTVKPNDRRINEVRRGTMDRGKDNKVDWVAQTIYQMKKNKQEGLANDVALKLLDNDQDLANQAIGIAVRALIADSAGQDIPDEKFSEQLGDTLQTFANRMKSDEERIEQAGFKILTKEDANIPTQEDVEFDESGGTVNKPNYASMLSEEEARVLGLPTDGTVVSMYEGVPAFANEQELQDFLSKRPDITREDVIRILGEERLKDSETSRYSVSPQNIANIVNASATPEFPVPVGTTLTYKPEGFMGYQIKGYDEDGNPQYVFVDSKGKVSPSTKINEAMMEDAQKLFEAYGK